MSYSKEELSQYRLDRAKETLDEAKLLGGAGHWNTVANRLYYVCFYGASAYLVINGLSASTHTGIKNAFNKELIKTGMLESKYGLLYNKLFSLWQDADYRDYRDVTEKEIQPLILEVESLIESIQELIESQK